MKLLFDQNLSPRLPRSLADLYPKSMHVREVGLREDSDFRQRSLLFGHPPKFVWLRVGNCPVRPIEKLLRKHAAAPGEFVQSSFESHLMLP